MKMKMLDLKTTNMRTSHLETVDEPNIQTPQSMIVDPQRSMLNTTSLNLCCQGLICFVHSPKDSGRLTNFEFLGRRGPSGLKGLNMWSIYGSTRTFPVIRSQNQVTERSPKGH